MSINKLMIGMGLCLLLVACSTGQYPGSNRQVAGQPTTTELGVRYLLGRGVAQSDEKAFYYFSEAANDDDPFAQNELAYLYASGKGTPRDSAKALIWYQKAADHGLASAQYNLGLMYETGLGTPPNKALALKWFQQSASHGFEPAREALAHDRS